MAKRVECLGIHKRLNRLLISIGGYDYKYHASKLAEEFNLKVEDIILLMEKTRNDDRFYSYFNMLRDGYSIEFILHDIEIKNKKSVEYLLNVGKYFNNNSYRFD